MGLDKLGGAIGAGIGFTVGGPKGALKGASVGYMIGGAIQGPPDAPKLPPLETDIGTLIANPNDHVKVVYGEMAVGGLIAFIGTSAYSYDWDPPGPPSDGPHVLFDGRLSIVAVVSEGEIDSIDDVEILKGDTWESWDDTDAFDAFPYSDIASFDDHMVGLETKTGASDQTVAPTLASLFTAWTSDHRLRGLAYAHVMLYATTFPGGTAAASFWPGVPQIRYIVKGMKVHDPRTPASADAWSDNPALCIRDYLTNTVYGRGIPEAWIDDDSFEDAADYCDDPISTPDGGSEKRYTINGILDPGRPFLENLEALRSSCRGLLVWSAGKFKLVIDKYESAGSVYSFTDGSDGVDANIVGALRVEPGGKSDRFNRMIGRFYNPDKDWKADEVVADSETLRDDNDNGLLLSRDLDLPFVTAVYQVTRLLNMAVNQSRQSMVVSFRTMAEGLLAEVGDVIDLTIGGPQFHGSPYFWEAKNFRVLEMNLLYDDEIEIIAQEYDDDVYDYWTINTVDNTPNTDLPDVTHVDPPGGLDATEELYTTTNSSGVKTKLLLSWVASEDPYLDHYLIEFDFETSYSYTVAGTTPINSFEMLDLEPGLYAIRVSAINSLGFRSDYAERTKTVHGLTAPPSDIANASISYDGMSLLTIRWDAVSDLDVIIAGGILVRHSESLGATDWESDYSGIEYKVPGAANSLNVPPLSGSYMLRAVDSSGNMSTNTTVVDTTGLDFPENYDTTATIIEDSSFLGTHSGTQVAGLVLELQTGEVSGLYTFANMVDLTTSRMCTLTRDISATLVNRFSTIDDRTENIDDWPDFDGVEGVSWTTDVILYGTDSDPASLGDPPGAGWDPLGYLNHGTWTYRGFAFLLVIGVDDSDYNIEVDRLRVDYEYNASGMRVHADASLIGGLTADRAVVTGASGYLTQSAVTAAELAHVSGVTSALQTQLNNCIHDNKSAEINVITAKSSGVSLDDVLLIEDSADSYNKKKITIEDVLADVPLILEGLGLL